jgi:hypothetical protein
MGKKHMYWWPRYREVIVLFFECPFGVNEVLFLVCYCLGDLEIKNAKLFSQICDNIFQMVEHTKLQVCNLIMHLIKGVLC